MTDQHFIEGLKQGGIAEERAVSVMIKRNRSMVFGMLRSKGAETEQLEDIFIEGVTTLVLNVRSGKFQGKSSLSTYLVSICQYKFQEFLRREKRYMRLEEERENDTEPAEDLLPDLTEKMQGVLVQLGALCKLVLTLHYLNYSMTEIAEQAGFKTAQNAMNKRYKCFKKLMLHLEENPKVREELRSYL